MILKIKKLNPEAKLPSYAHPGDVGLDLFSLEDYDLKPGERKVFLSVLLWNFRLDLRRLLKIKAAFRTKPGFIRWVGFTTPDTEENIM